MSYFNAIPDENIWLDKVFKYMVDITVVILLAILAIHYFGSDVKMDGNSMQPTVNSGNIMLINKMSYQFHEPKRFDVVAFDDSLETDGIQENIKRIVGLPGDKIQIKNGAFFVNGKETKWIEEKDAIVNAGAANDEITLGKDEYFVMGDNWNNSEDSRFSNIGNIKKKQIIGKVFFKVSPFQNIGTVK